MYSKTAVFASFQIFTLIILNMQAVGKLSAIESALFASRLT